MTKKNIVLITRTWCGKNKKKYDGDIKEFIHKIYEKLDKIIILVNVEKETDNHTRDLLEQYNSEVDNKLKIVDVKPWGVASGAFNIGLNAVFIKKEIPDYILIASKEVIFDKKHIKIMSKILNGEPNMLVVGYALKANLPNLNNLEKGHIIKNNVSDALRVPWNTCAMWNADLFFKNVKSFQTICDYPNLLGKKCGIRLRGMEDALAIALAKRKDTTLKIGLINDFRTWDITAPVDIHKEKMHRKSLVYDRYQEFFGAFDEIDVILYDKNGKEIE